MWDLPCSPAFWLGVVLERRARVLGFVSVWVLCGNPCVTVHDVWSFATTHEPV